MSNYTKKDVVNELQREINIRKAVWKSYRDREGSIKFFDLEQEKRYNILCHAHRLFQLMTDKEYAALQESISKSSPPRDTYIQSALQIIRVSWASDMTSRRDTTA